MRPPVSCSADGLVRERRDVRRENLPVGGILRHYWKEWCKIGASCRVVCWLRYGYPLKFQDSVVREQGLPTLSVRAPQNLIAHYSNQQKQDALLEAVRQLQVKHCVEEMAPDERGYFSRVFLVPKKSGGWRLVIDLSTLNLSLAKVTYVMDTLAKIKETAREEMWATSLDLSDA